MQMRLSWTYFFGALGTEVTIIHRRLLMLREEDEDVARRFTEVYQRRFNMLLSTQVSPSAVKRTSTSLIA